MAARAIPGCFFDFIREQEGCVDHVYADVAGKLTAGYGHVTVGMKVGDPASSAMIDAWLKADAGRAADRLEEMITTDGINSLTDHQYAALVSFVFNVGANPSWTIWKRLKAKQFDQVPLELMKFVNAEVNGQMVKVKGLVNRRAAEVALWATDEPGTADVEMSSSVTRTADTPPTPAAPGRSKALIIGTAGAVAGAGPMIDQVSHAIAPYAERSHYLEGVMGVLAMMGAACAAIGLFYVWLQARNARN
jgi:GH24 family phage-related lysozyme (muramidase)